QVCDRQPVRILGLGLEPIPITDEEEIEVALADVAQTTVAHRLTIRPITVHRLMAGLHKPLDHGPAFIYQIGDRRRHGYLGHESTLLGADVQMTIRSISSSVIVSRVRSYSFVVFGEPSAAICCACSRVPPLDRYAVIPVALNVWQHVDGGRLAAAARRLIT